MGAAGKPSTGGWGPTRASPGEGAERAKGPHGRRERAPKGGRREGGAGPPARPAGPRERAAARRGQTDHRGKPAQTRSARARTPPEENAPTAEREERAEGERRARGKLPPILSRYGDVGLASNLVAEITTVILYGGQRSNEVLGLMSDCALRVLNTC